MAWAPPRLEGRRRAVVLLWPEAAATHHRGRAPLLRAAVVYCCHCGCSPWAMALLLGLRRRCSWASATGAGAWRLMLEPLDALVVARLVPWRRGLLLSCAMRHGGRRRRWCAARGWLYGRAGVLLSPVLMVALGDGAAACICGAAAHGRAPLGLARGGWADAAGRAGRGATEAVAAWLCSLELRHVPRRAPATLVRCARRAGCVATLACCCCRC